MMMILCQSYYGVSTIVLSACDDAMACFMAVGERGRQARAWRLVRQEESQRSERQAGSSKNKMAIWVLTSLTRHRRSRLVALFSCFIFFATLYIHRINSTLQFIRKDKVKQWRKTPALVYCLG